MCNFDTYQNMKCMMRLRVILYSALSFGDCQFLLSNMTWQSLNLFNQKNLRYFPPAKKKKKAEMRVIANNNRKC